MIIARTDVRATHGFAEAMDRAHQMAEAGADMLFVEAPLDIDEITAIGQMEAPQLINFVVGGQTPMLELEALRRSGFSFVLYANAALQASIKAQQTVLSSLYEEGSLTQVAGHLASFEERQRVLGKPTLDALTERYVGS